MTIMSPALAMTSHELPLGPKGSEQRDVGSLRPSRAPDVWET